MRYGRWKVNMAKKKRSKSTLQIPFPEFNFKRELDWAPPESLPDLSDAKEIAIDLETRDKGLGSGVGPGWATKNGYPIGIAVAVEGWKGYFPIAHEGGGNMDKNLVLRYMKEILKLPCDKVFHNAIYDVGWMHALDLQVNGRIIDTLIAAPLVDENRYRYTLDDLGKEYVGEKKSQHDLYEAAKEWGVDPKTEMWRLPPMYVGPYAEQDAALTLKLWGALKTKIIQDDLLDVFKLESDLFPVLFEMKKQGVRIDLDKAEATKKDLYKQEQGILKKIHDISGMHVDIWAAASVAKAFDAQGITYDKTEKTKQAKLDKEFLVSHPSDLARLVVKAREINKARTTFIDSILKHSHRGRIFAEVNQMRNEQGGTISGRLSMQNPNLQQIPARDEEIGPLIRSLFIPEEGTTWGCFDYSQQEPRLLVHYASVLKQEGSETLVNGYREGDIDFHQVVADMAGIKRKEAKTINLGMMYGMGKAKLADQLNLSLRDAEELFTKYHSNVPFVRAISKRAMKLAGDRGYIRTLKGRKCRFDLWEPLEFGAGLPLPRNEAAAKYGGFSQLKRGWTYKALNRLIQGGSADQTKQAMVSLYDEGFLPMIQVHDEVDISVENEKQAEKIKEIMQTCVELNVPSVVDYEKGASWGEIK
jgi:DNA polymerase I-like protein with 3'-5' exonuclease and polymerase domains